MTKDSVIDIIHKTIYGFFDVVEDDSEEPINEKDKLLLEVNKAVCNAIKKMPDDESKTGRWIKDDGHPGKWFCECGCLRLGKHRYCECCGAEMVNWRE